MDQAIALARTHLTDTDQAEALRVAEATAAKVRDRQGHGTGHTVVALVGSTGVGKSSLFNAVVGSDVSTTGVRRPTTAAAHAAVWGEGAGPLLDWLGIGRRHQLPAEPGDPLDGLVLVDLPDFDSTESANRDEVDRLAALVDLLVWVVDPQKYADQALHHGYLQPLHGHGEVMTFVLNKIDTVAETERQALIGDLERRLAEDGLGSPTVVAASVTTGEGLVEVESMLVGAVSKREAAVARLEADLRSAATVLGVPGEGAGPSRRDRRHLAEGLGRAAGVDAAGAVVAAQHRRDARQAMGWPPARLVARARRQPIAALPRADASAVAGAEIDAALRDFADAAAAGLRGPWSSAVRRDVDARSADLRSRLTQVTDRTARDVNRRPRWWGLFQWLQRGLIAVAAVGAVWLAVVAVLGGFLHLDTDPLLIDTPGADWIPLPSALLLGGVAVGLLLALVVRIPVGVGAARRSARARSQLHDRVAAVAAETVEADVDRVLADRSELERLLLIAGHH